VIDDRTGLRQALEAVLDRSEIEDALSRYSLGIDNRAWEAWDELFTSDAELDYTAIGLGVVTPDAFRAIVTKNDPTRVSGQHLHSNVLVDIQGEEATARVEYTMVNVTRLDEPGMGQRTRAGGWCVYELRRGAQQWQIRSRVTHTKWSERERFALPT